MARQYLEDVRVAEGFESISWKDILMRRVRLIAVPGKTEARTREARCKRKAVKLLGLCISGELAQANFEHCLLERHGPKVLFSPAYAVNLIYRAHLDPEFRILELKDEIRQNRMRRISREIRATDSRVQSHLQENLQNRILIRTLEYTSQSIERLVSMQQALCSKVMERTDFSVFSRSMVQLGFMAGYAVALLRWSI